MKYLTARHKYIEQQFWGEKHMGRVCYFSIAVVFQHICSPLPRRCCSKWTLSFQYGSIRRWLRLESHSDCPLVVLWGTRVFYFHITLSVPRTLYTTKWVENAPIFHQEPAEDEKRLALSPTPSPVPLSWAGMVEWCWIREHPLAVA